MPDGDWMNFERNDGAVFRQATYLINELRARGLEACMLTTFVPEDGHVCECDVKELLRKELPLERISGGLCRYCGGYLKALDDWYGAGGTTDDLVVVSRYEPADRITEYVLGLPIHGNARPGRVRALRALSLHDRDGCDLLNVPLKTMQRITGARRPQDVPLILADLSRALEIEGGLELEKRDYMRDDHSIGEAWDWKVRPRIAVKREFRATERSMNLGRFKMQTTSPTVAERIKHVEEQLERQKRDIEELARQVGITFDDEAVTEAVERLLEDLDSFCGNSGMGVRVLTKPLHRSHPTDAHW